MAFVMRFGLSIGLAGAAGIRAYLPLLVVGLLTRFSGSVAYRPPFRIFAAMPVLLLLILVAALELMVQYSGILSGNRVLIYTFIQALSGGIVFAGLFEGFGNVGGMLFGGAAAILSHLVTARIRSGYAGGIGSFGAFPAGTEDTAAVAVILLAMLLPWSSYFIWGGILFAFSKKIKESNKRFRPGARVRSWR